MSDPFIADDEIVKFRTGPLAALMAASGADLPEKRRFRIVNAIDNALRDDESVEVEYGHVAMLLGFHGNGTVPGEAQWFLNLAEHMVRVDLIWYAFSAHNLYKWTHSKVYIHCVLDARAAEHVFNSHMLMQRRENVLEVRRKMTAEGVAACQALLAFCGLSDNVMDYIHSGEAVTDAEKIALLREALLASLECAREAKLEERINTALEKTKS